MGMTPRERILATLNHEVPDRIPTDDAFPPQTRSILMEHFGTDDYADVLRELGVEGLIRKCGYDGGLVVKPSNGVQPDCPVENILACYQAARDFDVASLGGRPG